MNRAFPEEFREAKHAWLPAKRPHRLDAAGGSAALIGPRLAMGVHRIVRSTGLLRALPALVFVLAASSPALAQGCAMCGTAVTSAKDPLAKGLALSILLMLAAPNLLIASIGGWIFYTYRRASLAQRTEQK